MLAISLHLHLFVALDAISNALGSPSTCKEARMKSSNWIVAAMIVAGSAATGTMLGTSPRDGSRGAAGRLELATVSPRAVAAQSHADAVCGEASSRIGQLGPDAVASQESGHSGLVQAPEPPVEVARRSAVSPAGIWSVSERGSEAKRTWISGLARWHGARVDSRWTRERWELELVQRLLGQRNSMLPTSATPS